MSELSLTTKGDAKATVIYDLETWPTDQTIVAVLARDLALASVVGIKKKSVMCFWGSVMLMIEAEGLV